MKRSIFLGLLSTLLINTVTYADYSFRLNDSCESISGPWSGKGKASSWFLGTCSYHGTGTVGLVDSTGHFTVSVKAVKDSGSPLCPDHASEQVNAVCSNGMVTIKTEFGNLKGNFSSNSGSAKGVLAVSPGIEAEVSMQFYR
ncbi:hypothetical protein [Legionella sp. km772]|uniref:hypothetical protein n=1 Tax=Legionella sp. km772 TaxID=2498111 RepID=UPI000F8CE637|nr:hypothetical protein [Legionella sp. km772]RUR12941.1 hypothetical protein ELY15_03680 [Legionella sp. km772]